MSKEIHRVLTFDETRSEVIRLLAGTFGEDDDRENTVRTLTYGEIADALAASLPVVDARSGGAGLAAEQAHPVVTWNLTTTWEIE